MTININLLNSDDIIISCSTSHKLGALVAEKLSVNYIELNAKIYSCGEIEIKLNEQYKLENKRVIIFQGLSNSVNDAIYELLLIIEIISRNSPKEIIVFLPYLYYSRQDKSSALISQGLELFFNLLKNFKVKKVITIDIHSEIYLQNNLIELVSLSPLIIFSQHIQKNYLSAASRIVVIAPDKGAETKAVTLSKSLGSKVIILNKKRLGKEIFYDEYKENLSSENIYVLIDDIIDSGQTLNAAADTIFKAGAKSIIAYCTHGIFNQASYQSIQNSKINYLYITNSIERYSSNINNNKIKLLDISNMISEYFITL